MTEPSKPDVTLSDGREVTIDLNKISMIEFRRMVQPGQPDDEEYALLEKATGLADIGSLGLNDYRLVVKAFFEKYKQPVDPT